MTGKRVTNACWGFTLFPLDHGRSRPLKGACFVSIVRVGLGETKNYAAGYEAIFGKRKSKPAKKAKPKKPARAKKK